METRDSIRSESSIRMENFNARNENEKSNIGIENIEEGTSSGRLVNKNLEQHSSCRMEVEIGENSERRPKRGSEVSFRKVGEVLKKTGKVKHVGKSGSRRKNTCWIENDGTDGEHH